MTNKLVSRTFLIISILSAIYFGILFFLNPSFTPSFCDAWLLLSIICLILFIQFKKKPAKEKFNPLKCKHKIFRIIILSIVSCLFIISLGNLIVICIQPTLNSINETKYVILLGGGIKQDGTLGEMPQMRIKKAASYLKEYPNTKVIVTGGKCNFSPCAEAPILAQELINQGIQPYRILQEDKAKDTIQNFYYSTMLMSKDSNVSIQTILAQPITIITSNFHMRRSIRLAKKMGFKTVYGITAKTPAIYIPNTYCREVFAYIKLNLRILLTKKPEHL